MVFPAIVVLLTTLAQVACAAPVNGNCYHLADTDLCQLPQTSTDAFTVTSRTRLTPAMADTTTDIWLVGLSDAPGQLPLVLTLAWSSASSGWFGNVWGLQLLSARQVIPADMGPLPADGFLTEAESIYLVSVEPVWGHEYEATLGFTPQTGAVSVSVIDITTGQTMIKKSLQLAAYAAALYPTAGVHYKQDAKPANAIIESLVVSDCNVPQGVGWRLVQRAAPAGAFTLVDNIDRRRSTAITLELPWREAAGEFRVELERNGESVGVFPLSRVEQGQYHPLDLADFAAGVYDMTLQYVEQERIWKLDQRRVVIGQVWAQVDSVQLVSASPGAVTLSGVLNIESDGAIGEVVIGAQASLRRHTFHSGAVPGAGSVSTETYDANMVVGEQRVDISRGGSFGIPFIHDITLPADADDQVWQATVRPFLQPDLLGPDMKAQDAWLGRPWSPEAWKGFLANEKQSEIRIAPGVRVYQISGSIPAGPLKMFLLEVDLSEPGVYFDQLPAYHLVGEPPYRWPRSQISRLLDESGAIAGVNTDFAQVSTAIPYGTTVHAGEILRSHPSEKRGTLALTWENKAYIGEWRFNGELHKSDMSAAVPLSGVNPLGLAEGEVALFRSPWLQTPGCDGPEVSRSPLVVELVLEDVESCRLGVCKGVVAEVRQNKPGIMLSPDRMVITARAASAEKLLQAYQTGDAVEITYTLTGAADWPGLPGADMIRAASTGGVALVKNGAYADNAVITDTSRNPRTAAAVSADRSKVYFLVVDGRSGSSVGMTYGEMADFFLFMGAFEATNFDGGGSSTFSIKSPVSGRMEHINSPSDGGERYLPGGIGVFYTAP